MPYEPTIFETSAAGFALAPEMMQLNDLIRKRNETTKSGLDIDRENLVIEGLDRANQREVDAENDFAGFSEHLSSLQGLPPEEVAVRNRDYLVKNPTALRNKEIRDSIDAYQTSNDNVLKTKQNLLTGRMVDSDNKNLDFQEKTRQLDEESVLNAKTLAVEKSKFGLTEHRNMLDDKTLSMPQKMGRALGQSRTLPVETGKKLAGFAERVGYSPETEPLMNALAGMVAAHGAETNLLESYKPELSRYGRHIDIAQRAGINLDAAAEDPAMMEAARAGMRKALYDDLVKVGGKQHADKYIEEKAKDIDEAISLNSRIGATQKSFQALQNALDTLPDKYGELADRAQTDPQAARELRAKIGEISFGASKALGNVEAGLKQISEDNERRSESLKIQKNIESIISMKDTRENNAAKLQLLQEAQADRMSGAEVNRFLQAFRQYTKTKGFEKIKSPAEMAQLMKDFKEQSAPVLQGDNIWDTPQ